MAKRVMKKKKETLQRTIAGLSSHLQLHPNDVQSKTRLAKLETKLASL